MNESGVVAAQYQYQYGDGMAVLPPTGGVEMLPIITGAILLMVGGYLLRRVYVNR